MVNIVTIAFVIIVSANGVPVRLKPDVNAASIGDAKRGAYQIIDTRLVGSETWVNVQTPGGYGGWILWDYSSREMGLEVKRYAPVNTRNRSNPVRLRYWDDSSQLARIVGN